MKKDSLLLGIVLLFIFFPAVPPQYSHAHELRIDPSGFKALDSLCQGVVDAGNTPGVCLLIGNCPEGDQDFIMYQKAYGKRNETEDLTLDTLYDLASVTKCTFTTMAVMFLINDGTLSPEDYVYQYIPGFDQKGKGDVKIKHLLTHTSGLPAYTSTGDLPPRPNPDALINKICGMSKVYTTGEAYLYSCLNFITLARVVENITGECIHDFLKRRLWDQIGMIDSTYFPTDEQIARTAPTLASASRRGRAHDPLAWYYTDYTAENHGCGNAGAFSTVQDIGRLARLILHEGKLYNKELLRQKTVRLMTTKQTDVADRTYGWTVLSGSTYTNPQNNTTETCCIGHAGYTGTYVYLDKYSKTYIVLFTNYVYPNDLQANRNAFYTLLWGVVRTTLDHLDIYNSVPEDAFVVDNDNGAPVYVESGAWDKGGAGGYMSKTYRYAFVGTDSNADFYLNIPEAGKYKLHTFYHTFSDRASAARYVVNHKDGISLVDINQQINDMQWVPMGVFNFNPGEYVVRIDAKNSSGGTYVMADAIMAERLEADWEVVKDNSDGGYIDTSNFFTSSDSPHRYGADYRACNPMTGEKATWNLILPDRGIWKIFEWHNGNETRSSHAPFSIKHVWGEDTVYVNQQTRSGQWNSLGKYVFRTGAAQVSLQSVSDGIVIADSVKARPVQFEKIVDNLDADYHDTAGFFLSSMSPMRYDATYRACLTGQGDHARWDLKLPFKGIWEIYEWHNGNETRSPDAPFTITHAGGQTIIIVNEQINSGQWNFLGRYFFNENSGQVSLSADCSGDYVIADAIRALYIPRPDTSSGCMFY